MKKTLLLVISLLLIVGVALGLAGCKKNNEPEKPEAKTYSLDSSAFNSTAVFGEKLSLNGLKLVEAAGETVAVTDSMVTGADTNSAGEKELTISYNDQTFKVKYTVKFKVVYVVNGTEDVQLVTDASQVVVPQPPVVSGKQFDSWDKELPTVLVSNIKITAIYKTLSNKTENVYTWTGNGVINLEGYVTTGSTADFTVADKDGNALSSVASHDKTTNKLTYDLGENDTVVITVNTGSMNKSWNVNRVEKPTLTVADGAEAIGIALGSNRYPQKINSSSTSLSFKYAATPSNANLNAATAPNGQLYIDVLKAGVTELTVKVTNATNELEYIEIKQYVVITPKSGAFVIVNDATEYGIEDIWTVGRENGGKLPALTVSGGTAENIGDGFYNNISWKTNNSNVTVSGGKLTLAAIDEDPDIVEVRAVFGYKGVTFESAPMKVRCVYNGVNVYSYADLRNETVKADPRPIVLQANIKDDFSATNYEWMKSTYDLTYYQNTGATEDKMQIKVLMKFKDDLYGNGYEINAHNATLGTLDSTGKPTDRTIFRGPLNFVAMTQGTSGGAISVKGQDNIVFAVYGGVTLNNVILKSCDLDSIDGKVDLTDLNYAGTTVEILGDDVTIEYSRLMNGRTVLRVFGDAEDATKEINLYVKNTILKGSREFTARIGSNRFVFDEATASPYLPGDSASTKDYETKKEYNKFTDAQKEAYDEAYINTFVTFENCVFEDAGIFSIGLDAHFAGEALKDGSKWFQGALVGWKNLAKTSYGAKLTFKGDVRLYSWKPLSDIDSSTLMENNLTSNDTSNQMFVNMKFDVKVLVENASKLESYSNILDNIGGVNYVHAGIAFFGGGKNYSVFENLLDGSFDASFSEYNVKLSELEDENGQNQGYLQTAAGDEPFYFFIYNANNNFTYERQQSLDGKYDVLRK